MPTSATPSPFKKKPTSLAEELSTYQELAKEAEAKGNQKLAARWNLAAELIISFIQYLDSSRQLSFIKKFGEGTFINDRAIEAQEIAQYTTSSLAALVNNNIILAQELRSYAQETAEAGIRCRHWLAVIKNEIATHHNTQELSFDEAAAQYRSNASKAMQEGKNIIAQHWAEAACLAQEASRKKGFSISAYVTSGNQFLSSYWDRSRDASYDAAKLKVEVALALEQENHELAQEYDNLALAAEKLSLYREHLVRAIINGEVATIPHWRSAADFLSKSLEIKLALKNRLLSKLATADEEQGAAAHRRGVYMDILDEASTDARQLFSSTVEFRKKSHALLEEPLLSYQKAILIAAEEAAESHSELIPKLQKKKKPSLMSSNLSEQSYQEALKALHAFQADDLLSAAKAKERTYLYSKASHLSKKAAHAKTQWYTLGIPFLYWMYRLRKTLLHINNSV